MSTNNSPYFYDKSFLENLDVGDLPFVELGKRSSLPAHPGVYFVSFHTPKWIGYVGQSKSLKSRWSGSAHEKLDLFQVVQDESLVRIYYLYVPEPCLDSVESYFIKSLKTHMNRENGGSKEFITEDWLQSMCFLADDRESMYRFALAKIHKDPLNHPLFIPDGFFSEDSSFKRMRSLQDERREHPESPFYSFHYSYLLDCLDSFILSRSCEHDIEIANRLISGCTDLYEIVEGCSDSPELLSDVAGMSRKVIRDSASAHAVMLSALNMLRQAIRQTLEREEVATEAEECFTEKPKMCTCSIV